MYEVAVSLIRTDVTRQRTQMWPDLINRETSCFGGVGKPCWISDCRHLDEWQALTIEQVVRVILDDDSSEENTENPTQVQRIE